MELQNANPVVYDVLSSILLNPTDFEYDDEHEIEFVTKEEIFEYIRHLNDPEHPLTLEQLNVVSLGNVVVLDPGNMVHVRFTPTIPHCSMATLIGLSIRVKLLRSLPRRFKVFVEITPGTHQSEDAINKQLNDKERVAAALENAHLLQMVNKCIAHT
jgi:metal-sulfur cluster biosynthetic enzyme